MTERKRKESTMKRTAFVLAVVGGALAAAPVAAGGSVAQAKPQLVRSALAEPALVRTAVARPALVESALVRSQRATAYRISLLRTLVR